MKPPKVYELTIPSSHRMSKITKIVQSISLPPFSPSQLCDMCTGRKAPLLALLSHLQLGNVLAQGRSQINLVFLFLNQNLANVFRDGIFAQRLALANPQAIVADGFAFIVEVKLQHVGCFFGSADGLGSDGGHAPEVVNLLGNYQRV